MRLLHCHSAKQRFAAKHELLCALGLLAAIAFSGAVSLSGTGGKGGPPRASLTRVAPEVGEMDPRLAEALNAFGASRYDECLKLAEALAVGRGHRLPGAKSKGTPPTDGTIAEAVALIILSHLHQGDFAAARQAAARLRPVSRDVCQDLLAQVNREERDYQAEVTRLQQIVATTKDPAQAARAQLWTAHAHQRAGNLPLALQSYRELFEKRDPTAAGSCAAQAVRHSILIMGRTEQDVEGFCRSLVSTHGDSYVICRAALSELTAQAFARGGMEAVLELMPQLLEGVEDEAAHAAAKMALADAYLQHNQEREAERLLMEVKSARPGSIAAREARAMLATLFFERGMKEHAARSYIAAAQDMERALDQEALGVWDTATALRTIGLCYEAADQVLKAIPYLEQAVCAAPRGHPNAEASWALATCYYRIGSYRTAADWFHYLTQLDISEEFREMARDMETECREAAERQARESGRGETETVAGGETR